MDDVGVGRVFREIRIRLGWSQRVVAAKARISTSAYSRIERGLFEGTTLRRIRAVAAVLEIRLPLEPRWRGAALDRTLSSRHAAMTEAVSRLLIGAGWEVRPEVSFSHFGERGVVDILAWHPPSRSLLLVELKTELVDVNDLLAVTDRRRRLASVIARPFGWEPGAVGQWVVLAGGRTNERRVAEHRASLRAVFPSTGQRVMGWLSAPSGVLAALSYLPNVHGVTDRRRLAPRLRVRPAPVSVASAPEDRLTTARRQIGGYGAGRARLSVKG